MEQTRQRRIWLQVVVVVVASVADVVVVQRRDRRYFAFKMT